MISWNNKRVFFLLFFFLIHLDDKSLSLSLSLDGRVSMVINNRDYDSTNQRPHCVSTRG